MKNIKTLDTMMEESNWPSRKRWKASDGYGEGFLETRSLGNSIRGNMMEAGGRKSNGAACADSRSFERNNHRR